MVSADGELVVHSAPMDSDEGTLEKMIPIGVSDIELDDDHRSLRDEIKYQRQALKRLERQDKLKSKKLKRKVGLVNGVKRVNPWLTGLKQWNVGRSHYSIPKKGTPEHDEVMKLIATLAPEASAASVKETSVKLAQKGRRKRVAKKSLAAKESDE